MDENNEPSFNDVVDEPTPYGLHDTIHRHARAMAAAEASRKRTVMLFSGATGILVVGAVAAGFFITQRPEMPQTALSVPTSVASDTAVAAAQSNPSITIGVQKTGNSFRLVIQWSNLPGSTAKINIFYSATQNGAYHLIGSIPVERISVSGGNASLNIPNGYQNGYYYGIASGDDGTPLWTSSSTPPADDVSPPQNNGVSDNTGNNNGGSNGGNTGTGNGNGTGNTSTTNNNGNNNSGNGTTGNGPSMPGENFVVEHNNGKIQISWQSLPAPTYQLVISRSASDAGPWKAVLTETGITTDGPYVLDVVDDTLGDPYYYEMNAYDASGTNIGIFGPTLLSPL